MVTDTAVELLKKLGKGGMAGFVNAFLRNFDQYKIVLPEGDGGLALKSNYPLFAVKKSKLNTGQGRRAFFFQRAQELPFDLSETKSSI